MIDLDALRELLKPGEPQEWQEHYGAGRPHPPGSWVEIEYRSGTKVAGCSALIGWVWVNSRDMDIVRWRYAKRPPTDRELAAYVPGLLAMLDARNAS